MNLTSKRMLQFMTVCAGACALSSSAAIQWVDDSFESGGEYGGATNLPIAQYKMSVTNDELVVGLTHTNSIWTASPAGDASTLVGREGSYSGTHPMTNVTEDLVLNLNTEGTILSRAVTNEPSFAGGDVFVDTLIKFTPSEEAPSITDGNVKIALYVVGTNLVVYHKYSVLVGEDVVSVLTNSVITGTDISTSSWYRVTIQMNGNPTPFGMPAAKVFLNDVALTSPNAVTDGGVAGGEWFISANANAVLHSVAFQGTGQIDELVVANAKNSSAPSSVLLTLVFDDINADVTLLVGGTPVASGTTVEAGKSIVIDAKEWYAVTNMNSAVAGYSYGGTVGSMVNCSTGLLSATEAGTVNILIGQYSGGNYSTSAGNVDAAKLAAWADAYGVSEAAVQGAGWYDEYLLNVDVNTEATQELQITSIKIIGDNAEIKIGATVAVDFQDINGVLKVITMNTLGGTETEHTYTFTGTSEAVVNVPLADGKFMKAIIE